MATRRELDRILGDFFADGTDELADRVIDAALAQVDTTNQRRPIWVPRRFTPMNPTRYAVAAVIGVLAVGAALYAIKPTQPPVGGPTPTVDANASPGVPTGPVAYGWTETTQAFRDPASTATLLTDGTVLVTAASGPQAARFDPTTGSWTLTGPMIQTRRINCSPGATALFTATRLPDGKVLVAGGDDWSHSSTGPDTGGTLAATELYDPASNSWASAAPMLNARESFTATLLRSGLVLVVGGYAGRCQQAPLASAELYDPHTGAWTATGPLREARFGATATLLPDGRVLVAGGLNYDVAASGGNAVLTSAEIYDPNSGAWTATGPMPEPRTDFTATLLPNGKVLVVGGHDASGNLLISAELYDPGTGSWVATAAMPNTSACCAASGRAGHTATLLPDGRVLIAGGGLSSAILYDPVTGSWTETARMRESESYFTATLLLDGRVLVIGGIAELYGPEGGS